MLSHIEDQPGIPPEPDRAQLYEGYNELETDPEKGLARLTDLAERGSVMSMLYIAEAYRRGRGLKTDLLESQKWYRRAAEAGSLIAYCSLARVYLKMRRYDDAKAALEIAAAKEFPSALYLLGRVYFSGIGVRSDPERAAQYMERAVKLHHLPAKGALAKYLLRRRPGFLQTLRGAWLWLAVRIQFAVVLLTEGARSDRFR